MKRLRTEGPGEECLRSRRCAVPPHPDPTICIPPTCRELREEAPKEPSSESDEDFVEDTSSDSDCCAEESPREFAEGGGEAVRNEDDPLQTRSSGPAQVENSPNQLQEEADAYGAYGMLFDEDVPYGCGLEGELAKLKSDMIDLWSTRTLGLRVEAKILRKKFTKIRKLERKRHNALIAMEEEKTEVEAMLRASREDNAKAEKEWELAGHNLRYMKRKLEEERELLTMERDAARSKLNALIGIVHDNEVKLQRMQQELESERNGALVEKSELASERDAARLEKVEIERAQARAIKLMQKENTKLRVKLTSVSREKAQVETVLEENLKKLDEDREESLCSICLERPKDTLPFPCLHLHFCFDCLETHIKIRKNCPTCRTPVNGILHCHLGIT